MYILELATQDDEFPLCEAQSTCSDVELLAPGLATATAIENISQLAYTRRACSLIGITDSTVEDTASLLEGRSFDRTGSIAVRARNIRGIGAVDTQLVERKLGDILVKAGFSVDLENPDFTLCAFFSTKAVLGWLVAEGSRDFAERKPTDKPFFQPGSMDPREARAIVNIGGAGPEKFILDPMCGTGGLIIEAGLVGASVIGVDAQEKMTHGALKNLKTYLDPRYDIIQADATQLPLCDSKAVDTFDGIVFDAPYGRQSSITGTSFETVILDVLNECYRLAPRTVIVTDRDCETLIDATQWEIESVFQRPVHRSLTRYVHILAHE